MYFARVVLDSIDGPEPRVVVRAADDDDWVDVRAAELLRCMRAGASREGARRLATAVAPGSLSDALQTGEAFIEAARAASTSPDVEPRISATAPLLAPIDPVAYRDFMAFEEHFVNAAGVRGREPAPVLYEFPVSYFGNANAILGPGAEIPWPHYTEQMDYELELGLVIGRPGRDIAPDHARDHVLGVTALNDFSARDIQAREMTGGLGPSKGKHFGLAVGPAIATLDELPSALRMTARINGDQWSEGSSDTLMWSLEELVAWASAAEPLAAGTLLGSGTVGRGCGFELGRKLHPGDVVELEIERIGVLRNTLGTPADHGWMPTPREPST